MRFPARFFEAPQAKRGRNGTFLACVCRACFSAFGTQNRPLAAGLLSRSKGAVFLGRIFMGSLPLCGRLYRGGKQKPALPQKAALASAGPPEERLTARAPAARRCRPCGNKQRAPRRWRRRETGKTHGPADPFAGWPPPRWQASRRNASRE